MAGFWGIPSALRHARMAIISVALLYALSVFAGAVMVQVGYQPALEHDDPDLAGRYAV